MKDDRIIGYCVICDRPIYEGDKHYEMPDGEMVCDDILCLDEWAEDYERH